MDNGNTVLTITLLEQLGKCIQKYTEHFSPEYFIFGCYFCFLTLFTAKRCTLKKLREN